jgi:hypothetical protein
MEEPDFNIILTLNNLTTTRVILKLNCMLLIYRHMSWYLQSSEFYTTFLFPHVYCMFNPRPSHNSITQGYPL